MMKRIIFSLLMCMTVLTAMGQTARQCFVQMPDSLMPMLTEINRADCIDFLDSKMRAEVTNRIGTKSEMTHLTDRYIEMKMTDQSNWKMLMLPEDDHQIICVVNTVCGPICDSRIAFYTTDWTELPLGKYLPSQPQLADFFKPLPADAGYDVRDAQDDVTMLLADMVLSEEDNTLEFRLNSLQYLDNKAAEVLQPYVVPSILYVWQDGRFVRR